jgi:hypothetical protein
MNPIFEKDGNSRCHDLDHQKPNLSRPFGADPEEFMEMGGLEPPTPYMRNDSGSDEPSSKEAQKRRKES